MRPNLEEKSDGDEGQFYFFADSFKQSLYSINGVDRRVWNSGWVQQTKAFQ